MLRKLTVIAPGLLGASLAMAARRGGLAQTLSIWARRPEARLELASKPWCDSAPETLAEACQDSDLIVLCAPVDRIIELARALAPILAGDPVVTDVGSVKSKLARECSAILEGKARFVGSHPMAGSEKTGMAHGKETLFDNQTCFVTPFEKTDSEAARLVADFWTAIGARVQIVSPESHDETVAKVSHLPHILASALSGYLAKACPHAKTACGNGLIDTTRIASGDPQLWREIISQNRPEIIRAVSEFQDNLQAFQAAIANEQDFEVLNKLAEGKAFRDTL